MEWAEAERSALAMIIERRGKGQITGFKENIGYYLFYYLFKFLVSPSTLFQAREMLLPSVKSVFVPGSGESFDTIFPAEGPASGGNYVTITGSEFQATRSYVCTFRDLANSSRSVNFSAVYDASTEIRCVMGAWPFPEAITRLELRNNGTLVNTTSGPDLYNFKGELQKYVPEACVDGCNPCIYYYYHFTHCDLPQVAPCFLTIRMYATFFQFRWRRYSQQ
jgi:hypothetical protein